MEQSQAVRPGVLAPGKQTTLVQAGWIGLFTALTAAGAQLEIPHAPVPYTLQTLFVLLSGAILGKRNGAVAQISYLLLGACGLPVFAGLSGGMLRLLGPTGGYLLAFPAAAFAAGYLTEGRLTLLRSVVAMTAGAFVIFSLGTVQLYAVLFHNWGEEFVNGFLIFSWWDLLKIGASATIAWRLRAGGGRARGPVVER